MNQSTQRLGRLAGILEASAVALFLYQALRVLFSVLFGVVYDTIYAGRVPMSTAGLLLGAVILALLAPVIAPRQPGPRRAGRLVAALVVFLARIPLTLNDPQQRLAAALIIVAGAGIYLATRFREAPWDIMRALVLGLRPGPTRLWSHLRRDSTTFLVVHSGRSVVGPLPSGSRG
jgi:MFS family permease